MNRQQIEKQQERIRKAVERGLYQEGFYPSDTLTENQCRLTIQISGMVSGGESGENVSLPPMVLQGWVYRPEMTGHKNEVLKLGEMEIIPEERMLIIKGKSIPLTRKELAMLTYLVCRQGTAVSREELLRVVWGEFYQGDVRTIDGHVKRLRQKLGSCRWCLQTVRSSGYRFVWDTPVKRYTPNLKSSREACAV